MNEIVKKDILFILSELINILEVEEEKDLAELMKLSDMTVHNSSIFQDEDSISIALLVYSLSKVIERKKEKMEYSKILPLIIEAKKLLDKNSIDEYRVKIKKIFEIISAIDDKLKLYFEEIIEKSKIKKGSRIYEHGISLAQVADILGISQWGLMNYIGKTQISDKEEETINISSRLNFARKIFR